MERVRKDAGGPVGGTKPISPRLTNVDGRVGNRSKASPIITLPPLMIDSLAKEMLGKLSTTTPLSVEECFDGMRPKWAESAVGRLLAAEMVRLDGKTAGGRYVVTDKGLAAMGTRTG